MADVESKGLPSEIAKLYFWIVLASAIALFVSLRGLHCAGPGGLLGDLRNGPLHSGQEFWAAALHAAFGLCIFGSSLAIGHLIDRSISPEGVREHSHVLELARKVTVGAVVWLAAFLAANRFQIGSTYVAVLAAIVTLPLLYFFVRRAREAGEESRVPERASAADRIVALLIVGMVGIAFLAALATGTFAAAAMFWAMPVLIMTVFGWARESSLSRSLALIACAAIAIVPAFCYAAGLGFRDVLLVLISVFAAVASFRTFTLRSIRWAALLIVFLVGLAAAYVG